MRYDFDRLIDRRSTNSAKWKVYAEDVLPLWVADMDFVVPEPVIQALHAKVEQRIFGYEEAPPALIEALCARMERLYGWRIPPEHVVVHPGLVSGMNVTVRALCAPGEGVLIQTPAYPPFVQAHTHHGLTGQAAALTPVRDGARLRFEIDFDAFEAALTDSTRLFLLCQPQNPTGQIYTRAELERLAEICLRHNVVVCSDEIHSELLLGGARHIPLASLSPEIAERTITLYSVSKTFNLPGLFCSFAIIPDPEVRQKFMAAREGLVPHTNSLGLTAALAALTEGDEWLAQLCEYLTANRDALVRYAAEHFPGVYMTAPDATYLAWLDCRDLMANGLITGSPYEFFLERAKVALGNGALFGPGNEGFVRLNFGCPRATLLEALERMRRSLQR